MGMIRSEEKSTSYRNEDDENESRGLQGRMKIGRLKRRLLDIVRNDIKEKGLSGKEVYDRATWGRMASYIDPT